MGAGPLFGLPVAERAGEPMPLCVARRFPLYHEIEERHERRMAVARLNAEGWSVKSIATYLGTTLQGLP